MVLAAGFQAAARAPAAPASRSPPPCMVAELGLSLPTAEPTAVGSAAAAAEPRGHSGMTARWYPVALSEQLGTERPFATRLFGEPIVLYRDRLGAPVAVADVCPHRSAPLSMGDVEEGQLRCFYHGWAFGEEGRCTSIPTIPGGKVPARTASCESYAVEERAGALWVWRGNALSADGRRLPEAPAEGLSVCTVLDYECDWAAVVAHRLDAEPLAAASPLLRALSAGAALGEASFDGPTVARSSASEPRLGEEVSVQPIAPGRCRALARHSFPPSPLLGALQSLPGGEALLCRAVRAEATRAAAEGYEALRARGGGGGAASPSSAGGGALFREWFARAEEAEGSLYFAGWEGRAAGSQQYVSSGVYVRHGQQRDDDEATGTLGLKRNYRQSNPPLEFGPARPQPLAGARHTRAEQALIGAAVALPVAQLSHGAFSAALRVFG